MRETLSLIFLLVAPGSAFAVDCTELNGTWQATNQGNSMEYVYLKVSFEPAQRSLQIDYFYNANESIRGYTETYIADGKQHTGDQANTGDSYKASCEGGAITIVRNFQGLKNPLRTNLSGADRKLLFFSDNGGESPAVTEVFVPGHF